MKPYTLKPFTVLLLYPDYVSDNFGHETYLAHVTASGRHAAVLAAQRELQKIFVENDGHDDTPIPESDFHCLAVFEGHLQDVKP